MESFLALIGTLFFMFLVLSAVVEVVLAIFRGTLERFGITWAKSKVSLDDALALSREFAPDNTELNTRIEAVKAVAKQLGDKATKNITALDLLKKNLGEADVNINVIAGDLNALATSIKTDLHQNERTRIFIMRFLAAIIGCILCWQSEFYIFQILANAPESKEWLATIANFNQPWINILVGGFAAAAGSSYWHDQLDKIRNLKTATSNLKKLKE